MNQDPRGTISRQGNLLRIDNALVEEVTVSDANRNTVSLKQYNKNPVSKPAKRLKHRIPKRARDGDRTRDPLLGKEVIYNIVFPLNPSHSAYLLALYITCPLNTTFSKCTILMFSVENTVEKSYFPFYKFSKIEYYTKINSAIKNGQNY